MKSFNIAIILSLIKILHIVASSPQIIGKKKVKFVSVVCRHGDRTPDVVYPGFSYTADDYFPDGVGGLTNIGKRRAFQLGHILRIKYNEYLGPVYFPDNVHAQSTDYVRTKMTLQLVLAGLYPPSAQQKWKKKLNWQPIPITYIPEHQDKLLLRTYTCKSFLKAYENIKKDELIANTLEKFDGALTELTSLTGWNMTDIYDLYTLHCNIKCLKAMKKDYPEWINEALPILKNSTLTTLHLMNYDNELKKLNGGALLREISENMMFIKKAKGVQKNKIFLYSSHDLNVYALLAALNVVEPHLPQFTSAVIIELFTWNNKYYVEISHYLGIPAKIKILEIPDCPSPCLLDTFIKVIKDVIPSKEELDCNK